MKKRLRKRFRIELLPTAEGLNLATAAQKENDKIVIFLRCDHRSVVEKIGGIIAKSLSYVTAAGEVAYVVRSTRDLSRRSAKTRYPH